MGSPLLRRKVICIHKKYCIIYATLVFRKQEAEFEWFVGDESVQMESAAEPGVSSQSEEEESSDNLRMYWMDAYEDAFRNPGT